MRRRSRRSNQRSYRARFLGQPSKAERAIQVAGFLLRRALQEVDLIVTPTAPQPAFAFDALVPAGPADLRSEDDAGDLCESGCNAWGSSAVDRRLKTMESQSSRKTGVGFARVEGPAVAEPAEDLDSKGRARLSKADRGARSPLEPRGYVSSFPHSAGPESRVFTCSATSARAHREFKAPPTACQSSESGDEVYLRR